MAHKPDPEYYSGRVLAVVYGDKSQAFYVLKMSLDAECVRGPLKSNVTTIRGDVPGVKVEVGTWFGFNAIWDDHPKYGPQLKIVKAPVLKDGWDDDTCEKILVSQGIGSQIAAKIRKTFPNDLVNALLDVERLKTVPGITTFFAESIAHKWKVARSQFCTLDFLSDLGLPQGKIRQVWSRFGDDAETKLSTDPWSLLEIEGIKFADCDVVARRLSLDTSPSNPYRVRGAVLSAIRSGKSHGHLFLTTGELLGTVRLLDDLMTDKDIALAVKSLVEDGSVKLDRSKPPLTAVYDPWSYKTEVESAKALLDRQKTAAISTEKAAGYIKALLGEPDPSLTLRQAGERYLAKLGTSLGMNLSGKQAEAVLNALTESVSIITGLPGSGKTTSLRMALTMLHETGVHPLVVAPTGIAAKRVGSVTGVVSSTIHRAFEANGIGGDDDDREVTYAGVVGANTGSSSSGEDSDDQWGYGPGNPHPAEVVVIDESSMVDQALLYRVLRCTRPDARLVFVGDAAQLPSVGAGNVLRDLIASKQFPTVALTEVFRQADTSPIVSAAHDIFHGVVPSAPAVSDFGMTEMSDENKILSEILSVSEVLYRDRRNFQVLSPRHAGTLGVTNLNTKLRAIINPPTPGVHEVTIGGEILREGDRVIVCKNDYNLGIYNGDVGKVNFIDKNAKEIEVKIHGPPVQLVRIPMAKARTLLRLAYAVTVHRCQGLEYDVVVMPLVEGFGHQLQRNLFYTAVTRAKKRVILLGTRRALERAVHNNREDARNTLFSHRLQEGIAK